ncbi:MAG: hypothetical protein A3J94_14595 [Syntrophus sp. RIFOXYC2_FULL_54_9]|nr:MAG: hypothetical protein A3J94_14595 [Syntrophus sp. RIFOXYC2_FULL_54_9]HBB16503.1 hypothetical protein [Syntrophus sp. (in: bacteria)]
MRGHEPVKGVEKGSWGPPLNKKIATHVPNIMKSILYLKMATVMFFLSLCLICPSYAAERDVTLQWDESIDAPYLQSYRIYYYTTSGDLGSLDIADYAVSYALAGGAPILINPLTDPKPITIDKNNTHITVHFSDASKIYYFVATAVDTEGLESIPTAEVTFSTTTIPPTTTTIPPTNGGGGGGCFIATAAFGSNLDPHVKVLRDFRDRYLLTNSPGQAFVSYYYRHSPPIAHVIRKNESLKSAARWALVPVVYSVQYPYVLALLLTVPAGIGLAYRRRKHNERIRRS